MNRRTLLRSLVTLPFLGWLKPREAKAKAVTHVSEELGQDVDLSKLPEFGAPWPGDYTTEWRRLGGWYPGERASVMIWVANPILLYPRILTFIDRPIFGVPAGNWLLKRVNWERQCVGFTQFKYVIWGELEYYANERLKPAYSLNSFEDVQFARLVGDPAIEKDYMVLEPWQ